MSAPTQNPEVPQRLAAGVQLRACAGHADCRTTSSVGNITVRGESMPVNLFDDDVGHHLAAHLHVLIDSGDLRVRLPQHPRAVAGGKKPFLPLDFLMAVWVR